MASDRMLTKARRMLGDGNVTVTARVAGSIVARVTGDHGEYLVTQTGDDRFRCTCPSLKWRCSHVIAVELVTGAHGGSS